MGAEGLWNDVSLVSQFKANSIRYIAQSAAAVQYTNCISAEG